MLIDMQKSGKHTSFLELAANDIKTAIITIFPILKNVK